MFHTMPLSEQNLRQNTYSMAATLFKKKNKQTNKNVALTSYGPFWGFTKKKKKKSRVQTARGAAHSLMASNTHMHG